MAMPTSHDAPPDDGSPDDARGPGVAPDDQEVEAEAIGVGRSIAEWVAVIAGAVLIALVVKTFLIQAFFIPSGSMEPTLFENDRVLVNKVSYRLHDIRRGDVVVFESPAYQPGAEVKDLIKRVVALPGEKIAFDKGTVMINGAPLDEPYLPDGTQTREAARDLAWQGQQCTVTIPCTIPAGSIWVMGDNRSNSQDSRYIGPIDDDLVVGRAFVIVWPLSRVGGL